MAVLQNHDFDAASFAFDSFAFSGGDLPESQRVQCIVNLCDKNSESECMQVSNNDDDDSGRGSNIFDCL